MATKRSPARASKASRKRTSKAKTAKRTNRGNLRDKDKPLSPQEARFCEEYIIDLNGAQAAIRANYAVSGARVQAARLLTRDNVVGRIDALILARSVRTGIRADQVLNELAKLAYSNVGAIIKSDGSVRNPKDWPEDFKPAVASLNYSITKDGRVKAKVKLWDKTRAINLAMQHLGIVKKRFELTGANGKPLEARRVNIYMPDNGRSRRGGR